MAYHLNISSISNGEPIEAKHQRLFARWLQFGDVSPWSHSEMPRVPVLFRGGTLTHRAVAFANPHIAGEIYYALRNAACVHDSDFLDLQFDPQQVDYAFLLNEVVPMLIDVFSPWRMVIGDDQFEEAWINPDGPNWVGGPRACGGFMEPVFFMSADEIKSTTGHALSSFLEKITPVVEKVIIIGNGALVIGSSSILPFDEAVKLTRVMESSLRKETFLEKTRRLLGMQPVKRD